ncbi:MarR family transcriptional regulator [Kitasatospora sp. GP82]|uniref:MarR family winged helix-turn-helix transcriptional regulator n=1 Tax=Kitasatospora sp. GP82 TaxID=3035089 RepID=UPI0024742D05|nr:MarR family transcriptional regulator [Kitasatospora sp. GP82]MDH6128899.1 DNA-binding MarR family transcriptional regulator [Kitasatospora sp. GP82]
MTQSATPRTAVPTPVQLMDQLARAAAGYYRHFAAVAAERGLTLMQGKMLSLLREPRPMRTLADLLACDASNVTGIVDRLQARGLVRREVDPADRRIKNVMLTEEGEETVRLIRAELMSNLTTLEQLSDEERQGFQNLLSRVFPEPTD